MIKLEAGYSFMEVKIPHVGYAFIENFEDNLYEFFAGSSVETTSFIGEVKASNDKELTERMQPFIIQIQQKLSQKV